MEVMKWEDRIDGVSEATAEDLNTIAKELISTQEAVTELENKEEGGTTETGRTLVINTQEEWDSYASSGFLPHNYVIVNCDIELSANFTMAAYETGIMFDFRNRSIYSQSTPYYFNAVWDYGRAGVGNTVKNAQFQNVLPQYFKRMEDCHISGDVYTCNNMHSCEIGGTAYGCTGIIGCTAKGVQYCNTVLLNSYDGVTMRDNTNVIGG